MQKNMVKEEINISRQFNHISVPDGQPSSMEHARRRSTSVIGRSNLPPHLDCQHLHEGFHKTNYLCHSNSV